MRVGELMDRYRGKRVTVMGLGRFGGGVGAARFLATQGAEVTVTDLCSAEELAGSLRELEGVPLAALHLGGHREQDFREAEILVRNPSVPPENEFVQLARRSGAELTSEMNLFWRHNRGRTIAVTGSNGKSTTAALIHALLGAAGLRCHLGGNIGRSLLPVVGEIAAGDWVVLELSSFQLEDLDRLRPAPEIAVVTNFSANHLDRHGTLDTYRSAKQTICRWQTETDFTVLNAGDDEVKSWPTGARRLLFGVSDHEQPGVFRYGDRAVFRDIDGAESEFPLGDWLPLPGPHNSLNASAAVCCVLLLGIPLSAVESGLRSFQPLPHRLQDLGEIAGRRFFDDSIATTPESVTAALESMSAPVILLAGGYDKGVDLSGLAEQVGRRCKAVALLGQTGPAIQQHLLRQDTPPHHQVCSTMEQAFEWAWCESAPGDVILLSPGCASYDWYRDFRERGTAFAALVRDKAFRKAG